MLETDLLLVDADGKTTRFRRCGPIPDLFADENGTVLRVHKIKQTLVSSHPSVKYRNSSVMTRTLVADAWMPSWNENGCTTLRAKDGNNSNCALENLDLVVNGRGRPAGGALRRMAQIYQCWLLTKDMLLVAAEFDTSSEAVRQAVAYFE
jgi:hypothetical protein